MEDFDAREVTVAQASAGIHARPPSRISGSVTRAENEAVIALPYAITGSSLARRKLEPAVGAAG